MYKLPEFSPDHRDPLETEQLDDACEALTNSKSEKSALQSASAASLSYYYVYPRLVGGAGKALIGRPERSIQSFGQGQVKAVISSHAIQTAGPEECLLAQFVVWSN
jgi:hypothetical protein